MEVIILKFPSPIFQMCLESWPGACQSSGVCLEDKAEENPNVTLPGHAHGQLETAKGKGCKSYSEGD